MAGAFRKGSLPPRPAPEAHAIKGDVHAFVDHMLMTRYGPSGVVVDKALRIVVFRGNMNPYLQIREGDAKLDLLDSIRDDLAARLRAAISQAHQQNANPPAGRNPGAPGRRIPFRQDYRHPGFHRRRLTSIPSSCSKILLRLRSELAGQCRVVRRGRDETLRVGDARAPRPAPRTGTRVHPRVPAIHH